VPEKNAEREEFLQTLGVSREAINKFDRYAEMLFEWNQKFNLVAKSTLEHTWRRHFLDSAQLIKLIPKDVRVLVDLGSGAGFPGLVLSLLGTPEVHLIESTGKKVGFLRSVSEELKLNVIIHQMRVESVINLKADVVTARALKPLPELLNLVMPFMKRHTLGLFLKGQQVEDELTEATQYWRFACEKIASLSDPYGIVLKITDLKNKGGSQKL